MDPVTATALAITSLATTAVGAVTSGIAQNNAAQYQAQVARNNAMVAQNNATAATLAGEQSAVQAGEKTRAIVGAERAAFGAAGISPDSGSALDVQDSQQRAGTQTELTVRNNAARTAYGYSTQATSDTAQAQLDQMQGQDALAGSILSGASSVASKWFMFRQDGALGGTPKPAANPAAFAGSYPL